ncbi:MAG: LacI family DNA-binding transcriptional regulator [Pseudomonadota bacterium]
MTFDRPLPTLADVADAAGVSTATVSRCLNFPDKVAESTRKRVDQAVKELGYSPNFGARAMAAKRTMTIGAIIPTMENAIFARGLQAFQEELRQHGYTLLVASTGYDPMTEAEQIKSLVARGAEGLFLIGHERAPELYDFLETQSVPALVTWAFDAARRQLSVGFDNQSAMAEMAAEVLARGHRRLAMIAAATQGNDRAAARLAGIKQAMADAGILPETLQVVEAPYTIEAGAQAFATLMKAANPATAVLCGNDVLAVGALRMAHEMRLEVPTDVSITGFDDIELAQVATPGLTTVHVPHRDMGRAAARTLIAVLQGDTPPCRQLELPTRLVIRETLGPAPTKDR